MSEYTKALDQEGWSRHADLHLLEKVVNAVETDPVSRWTEELAVICPTGKSLLEVGCGTGQTSLWMAKQGRQVTAVDYTNSSTKLVREAASRLKLDQIRVVCCDAKKELPFKEKEFDFIYQAGLLEHFESREQVNLLQNWAKYGKYMVSMIPNASSVAYRVGKEIMERNHTWEYGLEIPRHSLQQEFALAGITVEREYSIGSSFAQNFLPKDHYLRQMIAQLLADGFDLDEMMQGYLLVTIGKCGS